MAEGLKHVDDETVGSGTYMGYQAVPTVSISVFKGNDARAIYNCMAWAGYAVPETRAAIHQCTALFRYHCVIHHYSTGFEVPEESVRNGCVVQLRVSKTAK